MCDQQANTALAEAEHLAVHAQACSGYAKRNGYQHGAEEQAGRYGHGMQQLAEGTGADQQGQPQ
ncbi:hypothetical protein D3C80_2134660 [compost metagenome]